MLKVRTLALAFLLLFAATEALAQDVEPYEYMDVFDTEYITDPQISPDGEQIVYARNQFDVESDQSYSNLWLINRDGSDHQALTSGTDGYGSPRWSPDGDRLAYISAEESSPEIFVKWMDTERVSSITNLTETPSNLTWSPDGEWLAFTKDVPAEKPTLGNHPAPPEGADWADPAVIIDDVQYRADGLSGFVEPSHTHIFVVSAEGGAPRQITSGDYDHGAPVWAPDGESLLFSANRDEDADLDPNDTHLYEVDVDTRELTKLTDGRGPYANLTVSSDGESVAYTWYEDEFVGFQHRRLFVMDRDGTDPREIEHGLDRNVSNIQWDEDGDGLYLQYVDEGVGQVAHVALDGTVTDLATDLNGTAFGRPYAGGSYTTSDDGHFAYTMGTTEHPADLAVGHRDDPGEIERLTALNENLFKARDLGEVEEIRYESRHDGWDIQGWVVYPPDFDPDETYPLILEIHGGPWSEYGPVFTPELQLKAAQGYVVLYTNPRGSPSYGEEFASYINHNYPSEDHDDLMSGVDYMLDQGFIDEDELFIAGGSGGGVLTTWAIGQTDRFAAAAPNKPVINWYSFTLTADMYPFAAQYWFTEKPWDDPDQYLEHSPISLVGNVDTPTMLMTGEEDWRTPMSETEQYYNALQLREVESKLVRIPGASHSIAARPSNLIRKVSYIVDWFDRYRD